MKNTFQLSLIILLIFSINTFSQTKDTFTDPRDNKTYNTVQIGNQIWMAENLKFWVPEDSPYYIGESVFYEGIQECGIKYGRLYQWETACKACPENWHLPTINEWLNLLNHYGLIFVEDYETQTIRALRKLPKEERKARKELIKRAFTNFAEGGESGLNVLYGGYLNLGGPGPYSDKGTVARFWSSSDDVTYGVLKKSKAEGIKFVKWGKSFSPWPFGKTWYCSVRCIKDADKIETEGMNQE